MKRSGLGTKSLDPQGLEWAAERRGPTTFLR